MSENDKDQAHNDHELLRRSSRIRKKPEYLSDYICLAEVEGERLFLMINEVPWDLSEAKDSREWVLAFLNCKQRLTNMTLVLVLLIHP